ncbi:hypothetical protein [uncultured Tateyamaria sp.]|uniref:hypothetical protein n=1 Tax=uncultured Tateyamaria sp. TaxID=455651 RepID=UPI00262D4C1A|nr:hypothetical protein [uncultured Tateyamaria sp.]
MEHKDTPAEDVARLVCALTENKPDLVEAYAALNAMNPDDPEKPFSRHSYHKGARVYFEE